MSQTPKHVLLRLNQQHKHKFYSPWKQPSEDPPESTYPRPCCRDLCSHDGSTSAVGFQQTQLQTKQWDILLKSHRKSTASFIIFSFLFSCTSKAAFCTAFWSTTPQVLNCCCTDCLVALSTPESFCHYYHLNKMNTKTTKADSASRSESPFRVIKLNVEHN